VLNTLALIGGSISTRIKINDSDGWFARNLGACAGGKQSQHQYHKPFETIDKILFHGFIFFKGRCTTPPNLTDYRRRQISF
jgi:hypothetical protein